MKNSPFNYLLFPQMVLPEKDFRHLSILLPRLSLFQVVRPPAIPEWAQEEFPTWPVIRNEDELEQVKLLLRGYQVFAALHGESSTLASISHEFIARGSRESRFQIQSTLKGKESGDTDLERSSLLEAAVFLEMARDLDEKELDLQTSLARVSDMEQEFREILGIESAEELEDTVETVIPPLAPEMNPLSFMLQERMACWLRLFHAQPREESPILVVTSEDVLEELLDPVRSEWERAGKTLNVSRMTVASIPDLENLPTESFCALNKDLQSSGLIASYRESMEAFMSASHDPSLRTELAGKIESILDQMKRIAGRAGSVETKEVKLSLIQIEDCTIADLYKSLDGDAGEVRGENTRPTQSSSLLLHLIYTP